jgi:hypothetical protein
MLLTDDQKSRSSLIERRLCLPSTCLPLNPGILFEPNQNIKRDLIPIREGRIPNDSQRG